SQPGRSLVVTTSMTDTSRETPASRRAAGCSLSSAAGEVLEPGRGVVEAPRGGAHRLAGPGDPFLRLGELALGARLLGLCGAELGPHPLGPRAHLLEPLLGVGQVAGGRLALAGRVLDRLLGLAQGVLGPPPGDLARPARARRRRCGWRRWGWRRC